MKENKIVDWREKVEHKEKREGGREEGNKGRGKKGRKWAERKEEDK